MIVYFLFTSIFLTSPTVDQGKLIVEIENIKTAEGIIWIGIYDSEENYLVKEKAIVEGIHVDKTGSISAEFSALQYGDYAIALFHDINGNGELDRNFIGIPNEPYAFSQKPRSKWRLPRYKEVSFDFYQVRQTLKITLKRW